MQQIITVAGPTVLLLGLVIYISVLSVARDKSGLIEEYGKNTGVDDPGEQMRNAAYHHNASRKYKCKKDFLSVTGSVLPISGDATVCSGMFPKN